MDFEKIKRLIDLVAESDITEFEITEGDDRVRIVKSSKSNYKTSSTIDLVNSTENKASDDVTDNSYIVKAPMVGTFYRSSSPGALPFVDIGQVVKEGDQLCIIEAMKLLNEIEADKSGVIKAILVDNGAPVEYGQHLFIIG
ncbi:acetyl-CoA carboxylase biotin carboxyl carrier protein [Candidatus Kinetoplastibacterium blastocrithidii TCC012E]|uniref:Biotin carboxyl carrier protein of acetyl-CoA carboxylase n=1 Tax=Candidatus Kinetoplastidibacterium blastocrithidiae TCC012E TaxID=1208922 RepID=M1LC64_9PROT|nr:acetyl-CoA carboxylase biotin carboxyl carrier protein [Candidatus Kinetoplastibacterium blastocrithidii]AFZ83224.1 acetyl-CoA carboxylase biotin carboxyl carrier protein [Candidatus Kinetoplastibacterium blastocrithidii (ex Strigomonas culicis)]AGF50038.1 acetyl-CoA carboxylase biotin carboxyl carrier protein [Candidatus Kinetoplastibacterium blastocrithidii TCC012E]